MQKMWHFLLQKPDFKPENRKAFLDDWLEQSWFANKKVRQRFLGLVLLTKNSLHRFITKRKSFVTCERSYTIFTFTMKHMCTLMIPSLIFDQLQTAFILQKIGIQTISPINSYWILGCKLSIFGKSFFIHTC